VSPHIELEGGFPMPIVEIHLIKGRTLEQKRLLVASVTKAITESLAAPPETVRIILSEMEKDDYAIAGTLMSDKGH
jgi:4-oxalocrotonate tautomerase